MCQQSRHASSLGARVWRREHSVNGDRGDAGSAATKPGDVIALRHPEERIAEVTRKVSRTASGSATQSPLRRDRAASVIDQPPPQKKTARTHQRPGRKQQTASSAATGATHPTPLKPRATTAARTAESRRACSSRLRSAYRYAAEPARASCCRPCRGSPA
jgi:hypothetical protein